ncbi:hypothetical protein TCAL_17193 [Tigriopus californicus]|uniref:Aminopeptidase N-like N-terminal domain-containing protein n=1 Tax=Tigriopus californicus TaxID=6832 RepID=A0A553N6I4_TIGCA|nr:hypothetical protein TCAL_17193 [Tigriopus californicus]
MSVINPKNPMDPSSLARPDQVVVKDVFLQLEADFKGQVLKGSATLTLEKVDSKATQVVLDSSDLSIGQVTSGDEELKFTVGEKQGFLGSAVVIELPKSTNPVLKVVVQYVTSPSASALQWLPPAQTAGKVHPYMFSQCQAIHCRSMVPLQDTPAIKMPYSAEPCSLLLQVRLESESGRDLRDSAQFKDALTAQLGRRSWLENVRSEQCCPRKSLAEDERVRDKVQ